MSGATRRSRRFGIPAAVVLVWALTVGSVSGAFKYLHEGMTPVGLDGVDLRTGKKIVWKPGDDEGLPTLVAFWATWSPRSLELLNDLKESHAEYATAGLRIFAVNVDGQGDSPVMQAAVREAVQGLDPPFPIMVDEGLKTFYAYGVVAVPSVAICGPDGRLVYGPSGYSYAIRDRIEDTVAQLLGLRQDAPVAAAEGYRPSSRAVRYHGLALQMMHKGNRARALENVDRAIAADSLFSSPHVLRGEVLAGQGDWKGARAAFDGAIARDSTLIAAWSGLGRCLLELDDLPAAEDVLLAGRARDDTYTPILVNLAHVRMETGREQDGLADLNAALELNSRDPMALLLLGQYQRAKGTGAPAVQSFRTAIEQLVTLPLVVDER